MTAAETETQTYRWVAKGFTEDIDQCERCGKPELKGTVRMVAVDQDGDEGDTLFMGVVCAAKHAGRKAEEIRHEAKRADAETLAAHRVWSEARGDLIVALRDQHLSAKGLSLKGSRSAGTYPAFGQISEALDAAHQSPEMAAWLRANPEPRDLLSERLAARIKR